MKLTIEQDYISLDYTAEALEDPNNCNRNAEINNIRHIIKLILFDIAEPEGRSFARNSLEEIRERIRVLAENPDSAGKHDEIDPPPDTLEDEDEEEAPDTERSPIYDSTILPPPSDE